MRLLVLSLRYHLLLLMLQIYQIDSFLTDSIYWSRNCFQGLQTFEKPVNVQQKRRGYKLYASYLESLGSGEDDDGFGSSKNEKLHNEFESPFTGGSSGSYLENLSSNVDQFSSSSSASFSAFVNSRTVPSKESHAWKPNNSPLLGKKPWQPQSSNLPVSPRSQSYLDNLVGSSGTSDLKPNSYSNQDYSMSSGTYDQNASNIASKAPQSTAPAPAPPTFEAWNPPESWSSERPGTSYLGSMSSDTGKMKKPWKPNTNDGIKSTTSFQMAGSSTSYLNSIGSGSKSLENSSKQNSPNLDLPTDTKGLQQTPLSNQYQKPTADSTISQSWGPPQTMSGPADISRSPTIAPTESKNTEGARSMSYLERLSPGSKQKPTAKSYKPGSTKGKPAYSSGSYLDNIAKPSDDDNFNENKYDNKGIPEPNAPKTQKSEDVLIPPFARTSSFLENLSSSKQGVKPDEIPRTTSDETISGMNEASYWDQKFVSYDEEPLQIVEEFVSITKAPGYPDTLSDEALRAKEFTYERENVFSFSGAESDFGDNEKYATAGMEPASLIELSEDEERDAHFLMEAIMLVRSSGGENSATSAAPRPTYAAVLVSSENEILGCSVSDFETDPIIETLGLAGFGIEPATGWIASLPDDSTLAKIASSTLYVTLEPSTDGRGSNRPTIIHLIQQAKISRIVVGTLDPAPDKEGKGMAALEEAGVMVYLLSHLRSECDELIQQYAELARSDFMIASRNQFQRFGRPLGLLHCSVIDSNNVEAFARNGNSFGTNLGGTSLSYRSFGAYELAPPPDTVWANEMDVNDYDNNNGFDAASMIEVDFDDEDYQGDIKVSSRIMPWYTKTQAVVTTFPRFGNGPPDDNSVTARLNGLKWMAIQGEKLPPGVERILVLDATDLKDLPLTNSDPNLPAGVDVEAFWAGKGRKPTRVILRRSGLNTARAAAAAEAATAAIESSTSAKGVNRLKAARQEAEIIQKKLAELQLLKLQILKGQILKRSLEDKGVIVEAIEEGEPVDVLKHLGKESGLQNVVWRAGCWGERGVRAIVAGAFQRVSAHVSVDAVGGKFWQLMIAENAIQAACGPQSRLHVQADQEDLSLEYCDDPDADSDCVHAIDGRPVRHVRVDCRVTVHDEDQHLEFMLDHSKLSEQKRFPEETTWSL